MAWPIDPYRFVSFQDAYDSPFTKLQTITPSAKFMTRDEVVASLNIVVANLNGLSGYQWVKGGLLASGKTTAWRGIAPYCIQEEDIRPYPMITDVLNNQKHIGSTYTDITASFAACSQAQYDLMHNGYGISGFSCQAISWTIGYRVYPGTTTSLARLPNGYYLYDHSGQPYACHLINSIITEITLITV